jgi:hypothetical protein
MLKNRIAFQHLYQIPSAICHIQKYFIKSETRLQVYSDTHVSVQVTLALTKEKVKKAKRVVLRYQIGLEGGQVRSLS